MSNMSYCRFENTAQDLNDCWENWQENEEELSGFERRGRDRILELAKQIVDEFGDEDDN